jgi:ASC-1-like (ASCH) protein
MATHKILIKDRPFNAIKNKTKNIEVRANRKVGKLDYSKIVTTDLIVFINQETRAQISCIVENVNHYNDVRTLLTTEGVTNTLSSGGNIEEGIKSIEAIANYKAIIKKNGVFAIKVALIA